MRPRGLLNDRPLVVVAVVVVVVVVGSKDPDVK